jgi:hypothetical protein
VADSVAAVYRLEEHRDDQHGNEPRHALIRTSPRSRPRRDGAPMPLLIESISRTGRVELSGPLAEIRRLPVGARAIVLPEEGGAILTRVAAFCVAHDLAPWSVSFVEDRATIALTGDEFVAYAERAKATGDCAVRLSVRGDPVVRCDVGAGIALESYLVRGWGPDWLLRLVGPSPTEADPSLWVDPKADTRSIEGAIELIEEPTQTFDLVGDGDDAEGDHAAPFIRVRS